MDQAKPEDKALPRRLKECCDDSNMDRHVRVLAAQLHQVFKQHPAQSSTDTETFTTQLVRAQSAA